jgi:hypothetical protein
MISPFQVRTTDGSPPAKLVASGDNCGFAMYSQHINIVTCHIYMLLERRIERIARVLI